VIDLTTVVRFALLLVRPGVVVMVSPALGGTYASSAVKIGLTVLLALGLSTSVAVPAQGSDVSLVLVVTREVVIGLALAMSLHALIGAAELAGHLSGFQIGYSYSAAIDPVSGVRNSVISSLYGLIALLTFLGINGHHAVLRALAASYAKLPIGPGHVDASIVTSVRQMFALIFTVGARLAAPMIVVLVIVELAVGLISRSAPALSFMVIGFPIRLVAGLLVLAVIVSTIPAVTITQIARTIGLGLDLAAAFR
jgi:flagellar biosynthetic protein FliR